ncbi:major facilitator superfamily transporter [Ceratobasidium sp. AG-Ba]|nr:major facilitator superfamily transporter [Ceratobasidium sp. AG-Ba]
MSLDKRSDDVDQIRSRGSIDSQTVGDGVTATGRGVASDSKEDTRDSQLGESALPEDRLAEAAERDAEKAISDNWYEDPRNPRLWPGHQKWAAAAIVSAYTFVSPLASSMMAPGLPEVALGYHITNSTVVALTLSIFLLAYAVGPLFLSPLSEVYGRTWTLHISNIFFLIFNLATAWAPNVTALIIFRFLAGLGGSAPLAIGAGSIGDLFAERDRAIAMSLFSLGPLLGPVIGPIAGGFITQSIGYQWVFRIISIASGVVGCFGIVFLRETYAPVLRRKYGYPELLPTGPVSQVLLVNLIRPLELLTRSMICFMLSLYMAVIYGFLYLLFVTFPTLFSEVYGWGPGVAGLAYLGPGVGFLVATIGGSKIMNSIYIKLSEKNGGKGKPEYRIPSMFIGSVLVPIGLFWYGWSAQARLHFMMPIVGAGIFGAGMMFSFMPIQLYLVDAFTYAASAVAAATLIRSAFGFAFPLFGDRLFATLGTGGGNSLLVGISIVVGIPFPLFVFYKGEEMRARNPLNR